MPEVWGGFAVAGAGVLAPDGDGQTLPAECLCWWGLSPVGCFLQLA